MCRQLERALVVPANELLQRGDELLTDAVQPCSHRAFVRRRRLAGVRGFFHGVGDELFVHLRVRCLGVLNALQRGLPHLALNGVVGPGSPVAYHVGQRLQLKRSENFPEAKVRPDLMQQHTQRTAFGDVVRKQNGLAFGQHDALGVGGDLPHILGALGCLEERIHAWVNEHLAVGAGKGPLSGQHRCQLSPDSLLCRTIGTCLHGVLLRKFLVGSGPGTRDCTPPPPQCLDARGTPGPGERRLLTFQALLGL